MSRPLSCRRTIIRIAALVPVIAACHNGTGPNGTSIAHPAGVIASVIPLSNRPFGVAISPDGLVETTLLDDGNVAAVPLSSFTSASVVYHPTGSVPTDVTFSPDGAASYVTNQFGASVTELDANTGAIEATIATANPLRARLNPAGTTLYVSTGGSSAVYIVSASTHSVVDSAIMGGVVNGIAFHPSRNVYYASSPDGGSVAEVDAASNTASRTFSVGGRPQDVAVSPDGQELWVADESAGVDVVNLQTGAIQALDLPPSAGGAGAFGLAISPDGARVYVTVPSAGRIIVMDRAQRTVVTTLPAGVPRRVAFSKDGTVAVVADEQDGLILIE